MHAHPRASTPTSCALARVWNKAKPCRVEGSQCLVLGQRASGLARQANRAKWVAAEVRRVRSSDPLDWAAPARGLGASCG
eukprot:466329-Alexandrium_andersonii.AAC.1